MESARESSEEESGWLLLRASPHPIHTAPTPARAWAPGRHSARQHSEQHAVLAGGVQSCEDYQAAARQCSERLEKLMLRAGGHVKRDMLVQWRQDGSAAAWLMEDTSTSMMLTLSFQNPRSRPQARA